ncbi:hypothetical protein BJY00DRAFT_288393 [Aspergillus carlsbadensis]|nr:hypothetical protein BJY00DRAFT_288393 [Aspergillus carlsbadensis]
MKVRLAGSIGLAYWLCFIELLVPSSSCPLARCNCGDFEVAVIDSDWSLSVPSLLIESGNLSSATQRFSDGVS